MEHAGGTNSGVPNGKCLRGILGEATIVIKQGEDTLDAPTARQDFKALGHLDRLVIWSA